MLLNESASWGWQQSIPGNETKRYRRPYFIKALVYLNVPLTRYDLLYAAVFALVVYWFQKMIAL